MWYYIMFSLGMHWNPYDYEGNLYDVPGDPKDMDPIPTKLPGCIDKIKTLAAAIELRCEPLIRLVKPLTSTEEFIKATNPDLSRLPQKTTQHGKVIADIGRSTAKIFLPCLLLLCEWTLIAENLHHQELCCLAVFFTVAKSNGLLRVIFDCRLLNKISDVPEPVNLASIPDILKLAAELGVTHVVSSDFKAYFYELSLPEGIKKFFGLRCKDESATPSRERYFFSNALSMGYSHSPVWSQAYSWTCILKKPPPPRKGHAAAPTLGLDYDEIADMKSLPSYVILKDTDGKSCGFIVVVYDNIGVFVKNKEMAVAWEKRLLANAKELNFWWKEMKRASPDEPVFVVNTWNERLEGLRPPKVPETPAEKQKRLKTFLITFLGVELDMTRPGQPFRWRHGPEKLKKWTDVFEQPPYSHRDVARISGILTWDCLIRDLPFCHISDAIGALRIASRNVKFKTDWDKPLNTTLNAADFAGVHARLNKGFLSTELARLRENEWHSYQVRSPSEIILLASDATETRVAGVLLSQHGQAIDYFSKSLKLTHIYVKECQAIDAAVRWAQRRRGVSTPVEIRIAVDNKAAAAAAQYCYSSNESVNKMFVSLSMFMKEHNITLRTFDVHTKLNVADNPSRRKKVSSTLAHATTEILLERACGRPAELGHKDARASDYLKDTENIVINEDLEDVAEQLWSEVAAAHDADIDPDADNEDDEQPLRSSGRFKRVREGF